MPDQVAVSTAESPLTESPTLSAAREIFQAEVTRIGQIVRAEAQIFLEENQDRIDRILVSPRDHSFESGPNFRVLIVQREVRKDCDLEDRISDLELLLADKYRHERFFVSCMGVPFMPANEGYSSLAKVDGPDVVILAPSGMKNSR